MKRHAKASTAATNGDVKGRSTHAPRLRLIILAAVAAAFFLVPAAQAAAAAPFNINIEGTGTGTVTGEAEVNGELVSFNCSGPPPSGSCETTFEGGMFGIFVAEADPGSTFTGWTTIGVECEGALSNPECELIAFALGSEPRSLTAHFSSGPPKFKLSVTKSGTGSGTVKGGSVAEPSTINCGSGSGCEHEYEEGALVTLTHEAPAGSEFKEWTGACSGSGTCEVTMSAAKSVGAKFDLEKHLLSVTESGTGSGEVTSSPVGIACGGECSEEYNHGTLVTLSQTASAGSEFKEWTGACSGSGTCEVTMSEAKSVDAKFDLEPVGFFKLTVTKSGTGTGTVTSSPAGINCGVDCEENYAESTVVTLSKSADPGSEFKEWTGACSGSGTCEVTMSAAKSVGAKFDLESHTLTVSLSGTGTGTVTGPGISCPGDCTENYSHGTVVTLSKSASAGSEFKEWTGVCSGSGTCEVTMSAAKSVGAKFDLEQHLLSVTKSGTGTGEVTSSPAGIACGVTCSASFAHGTVVTLSKAASAGSVFVEWTGACSGSGTCEVTMSAAKSVGAKFDLEQHLLSVTKPGTGTGTVTSSPAGISCGATCSANFNHNAVVTLTKSASAGSEFKEWTGACSGSGTCEVTMSAAKSVGAKFDLIPRTLTIVKAGTGSGSVTCDGGACAASYPNGTTVTLAATAASGSTFAGWSGGGCSGAGNCVVTLSANTTVTATFNAQSSGGGGGGGGSTPPPAPAPPPTPTPPPPTPKPLKCKKGFKKKTVKGKAKCVKVKKHKKKH